MSHDYRQDTPARILVISHEASRTGAPIVLLHLLRWMRANTPHSIEIALYRDGPLRPDFEAIGPVRSLGGSDDHLPWRVLRRLGGFAPETASTWLNGRSGVERLLRLQARRLLDRHMEHLVGNGQFDLVYANSATTGAVVRHLPTSVPLIAHVHELDYQLTTTEEPAHVRALLARAARVIAVAGVVKESLVEHYCLEPGIVDVCYEFVPCADVPAPPGERQIAREKLNVGDGHVLVGAVGTPDWRKGIDLFLQLALLSRRRPSTAHLRFAWLGTYPGSRDTRRAEHDVRRMGLDDIVTLLPATPDPRPFFAACDLFALTSRSDPFPLVALEAAAARLPIVCYEGAGGMPEFVESDAGRIAPYGDVVAMAGIIRALANDRGERAQLGAAAFAKVRTRHDVSRGAPAVYEIIRSVLAG